VIVSCRELMPIVRAALESGSHVRLTATGGSMFPFVRNGEVVELQAVPRHDLRPGDVVLAERPDESYILHRIAAMEPERVFMVSDAGQQDGWFTLDRVYARARAVERKGRWRRLDTPRARRAGLLWAKCRVIGPPLLAFGVKLKGKVLRQRRTSPDHDARVA
jgi:hypothetical protein